MESVECVFFLTKHILCLSVSPSFKTSYAWIKQTSGAKRGADKYFRYCSCLLEVNFLKDSLCCTLRALSTRVELAFTLLSEIIVITCCSFFPCRLSSSAKGQTGCSVCFPEKRLRQSFCHATSSWRQGETFARWAGGDACEEALL